MSWLSTLTGVLFLGSSLLDPASPQMFAAVMEEQGVSVATLAEGDPSLIAISDHAVASGADSALTSGDYNTVVITVPPLDTRSADDSAVIRAATDLHRRAIAGDPQTRVFFAETWPDLRSGTGTRLPGDPQADLAWRDRVDASPDRWHAILNDVNAQRPFGAEPVRFIPLPQALARLSDEAATGNLTGVSSLRDLFADDRRVNDLGSYYLAMVQYAVVTGETPVGLPRRLKNPDGKPFAPPTPVQAQSLQSLAQKVIERYHASAPPPPDALPPPATADTGPKSTDAPKILAESPAKLTPPQGDTPLAIGLMNVRDWGTQQAFLDVFKTARSWIGHVSGQQWGGVGHDDLQEAGYLDDNGWPVALPPEVTAISALILTDLPEDAEDTRGRYRLTYDGQGILEVTGRATNVRYGQNEIEFDFTPGSGPVDIRIQRTDPNGDHIRNISVVKREHIAAVEAGAIFNPLWLERLEGFEVIRFMNWTQTNNSAQREWSDRPKPSDYTYTRVGVPLEVMIELLNRTGIDGWFNIPHLADDDYMRRSAQMVKDRLWVDQKAYAEFSNEVWNRQFEQAAWADEMAKARWGKDGNWVSYYAVRAMEMAQIWTEVFGAEATDRLVRVVATQTGWLGLEKDILTAPLWLEESPDNRPPADYFDAYAVTGYFGYPFGSQERLPMVRQWIEDSTAAAEALATERGLQGEARADFMADHRFDLATAQAWAELRDGASSGERSGTLLHTMEDLWPYHANVAKSHGLDLIMYEGGTHVVGLGPTVDDPDLTEFLVHLNYSPEMGELYAELISGWYAVGGTLFNAFLDVAKPGKWGSWGHLRHLTDDNPRWQVLEEFK